MPGQLCPRTNLLPACPLKPRELFLQATQRGCFALPSLRSFCSTGRWRCSASWASRRGSWIRAWWRRRPAKDDKMEGDLKPAGDSPDIGRQAGGGSTTTGRQIDLDSCGTAASSSMQGQGTQGNERNGGRIAKLGREERRLGGGFNLPTGPAKPPGSGTGIPVRFGRKPVGTGRSQIWI